MALADVLDSFDPDEDKKADHDLSFVLDGPGGVALVRDVAPADALGALGELAALASIYEGLLLAHETNAPVKDGVLWPSVVTLYAAMAMQSEFNGRMLEIIRELVSSSVISQPSSAADFENPEIGPAIERYMRGGSMDAKSRTALSRLLWDFLGTEFGSRHAQYEKFYGGAPSTVKQNVYRNFDFKRATGLVDKALNLPALRED